MHTLEIKNAANEVTKTAATFVLESDIAVYFSVAKTGGDTQISINKKTGDVFAIGYKNNKYKSETTQTRLGNIVNITEG